MLQQVFAAILELGWFVVILKARLLVLRALSFSPRAGLWKTEPRNLGPPRASCGRRWGSQLGAGGGWVAGTASCRNWYVPDLVFENIQGQSRDTQTRSSPAK